MTRRSWLERVAQRSSEGDQELELGYECSPPFGFSGRCRSHDLGSTPLTVLVETEGRDEETQTCHQDKVGPSSSRDVDDEQPYGRQKHHGGAGDEGDRPRRVMATE